MCLSEWSNFLLKIYITEKKKSSNVEILQVAEFFSDCVLPDVTSVNSWE